jgi:hypothetical protein
VRLHQAVGYDFKRRLSVKKKKEETEGKMVTSHKSQCMGCVQNRLESFQESDPLPCALPTVRHSECLQPTEANGGKCCSTSESVHDHCVT